jgi:hypothetical protein
MNTGPMRFLLVPVALLALSMACTSSGWYDDNTSDTSVWTHRILLNLTDVSSAGGRFPVTLTLGRIFGIDFNYSTINTNSLRVVDPESPGSEGSAGGSAVPYQLDYTNETTVETVGNSLILYPESELSFMADINPAAIRGYYLYYSTDSAISRRAYPSDLNVSMQDSTVVVENSKAQFGGFKTGYFALYSYVNKNYGSNIIYPELGLDYGYNIEFPDGKDDFLRYARNWNCSLLAQGPVRVQVFCNASSADYLAEKTFTFYTGMPYYVSKSTLSSMSPTKTQLKWNIYDVLKPYFKKSGDLYIESATGLAESKSCYTAARYVQDETPKNYFFMIAGRGDMDCFFLEDRQTDYDLFSVALSSHGRTQVTGENLYLFDLGGLDNARNEYLKFKSPPEVFLARPQVNRITVRNPSSEVFYDVINNESAVIPIEVTNTPGSVKVTCSMTNPYGDVVHNNVKLFNDGTHADALANDSIWTNGNVHVLDSRDPTGIWTVNCTEEGAQSIPTSTTSPFAVTYNYNYRRLTLCDQVQKQVKIRPGETQNIEFCIENNGGSNESNVTLTVMDAPESWSTLSDKTPMLLRGEKAAARLGISIPLNQSLIYQTLRFDILGDGVVRGVGYLEVEVVIPLLDVRLESYESTYGIHVLNERGENVQDATVTVSYPQGERQTGKTNSDGRFVLPYGEAGVISITTSKEGYSPTTIRLTVEEIPNTAYAYMTVILVLLIAAILYVRAMKNR